MIKYIILIGLIIFIYPVTSTDDAYREATSNFLQDAARDISLDDKSHFTIRLSLRVLCQLKYDSEPEKPSIIPGIDEEIPDIESATNQDAGAVPTNISTDGKPNVDISVKSETPSAISGYEHIISDAKDAVSNVENVNSGSEVVSPEDEINEADNTDAVAENNDTAADNTDATAENTDVAAENTDVATENTDAAAENIDAAAENTDAAAENTDASTEITDTAAENTDSSTENTDVTSENTDAEADNTDADVDNTDADADNTDADAENTDATAAENTDAAGENTDATAAENTDAAGENTDAEAENTDATAAENTDAAGENTDVTAENTNADAENTDAEADNTDADAVNTDAEADNTDADAVNTDAEADNTDDTAENTDATAENTDIAAEITDAAAENTDEAAENTDEAVENTDESAENTDEAAENTDEAAENTDEAVENTDEAVENWDTTPENIPAAESINSEAETITDLEVGNAEEIGEFGELNREIIDPNPELQKELEECQELNDELKEKSEKYDELLPITVTLIDLVSKILADTKEIVEEEAVEADRECKKKMAQIEQIMDYLDRKLDQANDEIERLKDKPTPETYQPNDLYDDYYPDYYDEYPDYYPNDYYDYPNDYDDNDDSYPDNYDQNNYPDNYDQNNYPDNYDQNSNPRYGRFLIKSYLPSRGKMRRLNKKLKAAGNPLYIVAKEVDPLKERISRLTGGNNDAFGKQVKDVECDTPFNVRNKITFTMTKIGVMKISKFDMYDRNPRKVTYTVYFNYTPTFMASTKPAPPTELPVAVTFPGRVIFKTNTINPSNERMTLVDLKIEKFTIRYKNGDAVKLSGLEDSFIRKEITKQIDINQYHRLLIAKLKTSIQKLNISEKLKHR